MLTLTSRGRVAPLALRVLATAALASALAAPTAGAASPDRAEAERALRDTQDLFHGRARSENPTAIVAELVQRRDDLSPQDRRTADALLARPTDSDAPADEGGPYRTEPRQICDEHFCLHWVDTTVDAPPPADANGNGVQDYIDAMMAAFQRSFIVENGFLGYRAPLPDEGRGGDDRMDIYVKELVKADALGIAVPDSNSARTSGYMLMDDDHAGTTPDPTDEMRDTASHEYNHILQFAYNQNADSWLLESGATWAGTSVYPEYGSYVGFASSWARHPERAVAYSDEKDRLRRYGSAVWNFFLTGRYGIDVPRLVLENRAVKDNAATAYDNVIKAKGGPGFTRDFVDFAASTAEWRLATSPYPQGSRLPDVRREGKLDLNVARYYDTYDHTSYRLQNIPVPPPGSGPIALDVLLPTATDGGVALVGRTGDAVTGATTVVTAGRRGGHATVVLNDPGSFSRITAVTVNSDIDDDGYDDKAENYIFPADGLEFGTLLATPACVGPFNAYESTDRAVFNTRAALKRARTAAKQRRYRAKLKRLRAKLATQGTAREEACATG